MAKLDLARIAAELRGRAPSAVKVLPGGRNNIVARVEWPDEVLLLKVYFTHPEDRRDRLGAEFGMLSFLWRQGIRCVPRPVAARAEFPAALYEFVEGRRPKPDELGPDDTAQLANLLGTMWDLRGRGGAEALPVASSANFSLDAYLFELQQRWTRLHRAVGTDPAAAEARALVENDLACLLGGLESFVREQAALSGLDPSVELAPPARTLSPADHGFHNTLRRADGSLIFLDFEYAGWDDPAQVAANAVLVPEVPMPAACRPGFVREIMGRFGGGEAGWQRLRMVHALLAFKWSLIMMNEFVPVEGTRRTFAGDRAEDRCAVQLEKARRQLDAVREALAGRSWLDDVTRTRHAGQIR